MPVVTGSEAIWDMSVFAFGFPLSVLVPLIAVGLAGLYIAMFELDYILHQYSKASTPCMIILASSMQAAGGAFFLCRPMLCACLLFFGKAIFVYYSWVWRHDGTTRTLTKA